MEIGTNEYKQTPTQGHIASEKDLRLNWTTLLQNYAIFQ